ncbi:MAG: sigma-54 dependent transcriptional regulator [Syntrophales bacterium]|nr:sigma-54 dependent transcriptional regulator [Syntrophales bacterium]MDD5233716.1 sigma-54 dependent transcriptional regulator [Syntrophales bacterium]MDD5531782.1 sigma-54 dependent transcriptional regulator [Syntrophales bacterium]
MILPRTSPYLSVLMIFLLVSVLYAGIAVGITWDSPRSGMWGIGFGIILFMGGIILAYSIFGVHKTKSADESTAENARKPDPPNGFQQEHSGSPAMDLQQMGFIFPQITNYLSKSEAREKFPDIFAQSKIMRSIFSQILKVAPTDATVLISGESGTGKELVATGIYEHSLRNGKPFVKLNCVAIPEGLLESELFGHEKGAFTGATSQKQGKFELANKGTIFLDEIGDMPMATQAKLLRALQEKEFERVGGTKPIKVDVRFIAATNKNLANMVKNGEFREDLFYRLNVFSIHLPPLRERREDISVILEQMMKDLPRPAQVSSTALQFMMTYAWPGNIRELRNVIERSALMAENGMIEPAHLPPHILTTKGLASQSLSMETSEDASLDDRLRELEKLMILEAMIKAGGIQVKAAQILGIKERSLWHRIKKHQIDVPTIKSLHK